MHLISFKKIREFCEAHPGDRAANTALRAWGKIVEQAQWANFADIRGTFNSADRVSNLVVFNVGGNKYRAIVEVFYDTRTVLLRHVLTFGRAP